MLLRSLTLLQQYPAMDEIVVAIPAKWPADRFDQGRVRIASVPGGATRHESVRNALEKVSSSAEVIVIHDAARPFASPALLERTVRAAEKHGAAIAALPVSDTVKQVEGGMIRATLPRDSIFLAQTPQAFKRDVLLRAIEAASDTLATDEAMLLERAGIPVHIVEGEASNIKVTTPGDLQHVRGLAKRQDQVTLMRIGTGYDLHRLVSGRPLILAGVRIPFELGLDGHSDADIVCHAVTDAVLGAAAAGDIGQHFPDTDPRFKDADSIQLLRGALDVIRARGHEVSNVDVTVIAERPKLSPHVNAMRASLAAALGVEVSAVSIKGKTNERVGEIGRGEAMACHAVVLLARSREGA
jgi:2-C-methyl-D-erythritol 4-phosphate cytidylyltransferase/2-C-methyl-D-erythritol 2,4-cyclodiphosphate synthase